MCRDNAGWGYAYTWRDVRRASLSPMARYAGEGAMTTCPAPDAIPAGRAYYISLRRNDHDTRTAMLAGPYDSHKAAHAALPAVHEAAEAIDPYADAYVWGCAIADRGVSTRLGIIS